MMTKPRIFISYASADKEVASGLATQLRDLGYGVWFDASEIRTGDILRSKIEKSITQSGAMVVVLSPATRDSEWVRWELEIGKGYREIQQDFRFLPVLLPGMDTNDLEDFFYDELKAIRADPAILDPVVAQIDAALDES